MDIQQRLATAIDEPVIDIESLGGGCVSEVYLVRLSSGEQLVVKLDEDEQASLPVEAKMLLYLSEHSPLPVPSVRYYNGKILVMAFMSGESRFSIDAEQHAAELLGALHSLSSSAYGFEFDTLIGGLPQPNPSNQFWIEFFRDQRLLYMAKEGYRAGRLPGELLKRLEKFSDQLHHFLLEPPKPSLIHGDVWTTNVLAEGKRIKAFLDPAIYFAHHEIELAFITLFNTFSQRFFERYQEIRPIAAGFFEERCDIYNLYPLLVHVRLFGGSYTAAVDRTLRRFGF
ncbi:MAG: fructosamine kinase family protein [Chloroflexota bacterium]